MNVRSGDTVEVITGKDLGKKGKVIVTNPQEGTVIVEGINMVTKHKKPRSAQEQGGKIEREGAIDVSNVALVCPSCGKTTRVNHVLGEKGKYVRTCHKCGALIDAKAEKKAAKKGAKKATTKKSKKAE
jgi:large subunit ribosomal protein L24